MKRLVPLAAVLLVAAAAVAEDAKKDKAGAGLDPAKLVGTWTYESGTRSGEKVDKEKMADKVVITKDTFTLGTGDMKFVIGYKIDTKKSPATIDMDIKDGPVKEGKAQGIIALKGDELKICYVALMGDDVKRPEKFESTKDNKAFYFVLKREKK